MTEGIDLKKSIKLTKRLDGLKKPEGNVSSKRIDRVISASDQKGIIRNKRTVFT